MADQVLLSANQRNFDACLQLALRHGLGIEVMAFANPDVLDGDWRALADDYRARVELVRGPLTLHGPFLDLAPGSPDRRVRAVAAERFRHAVDIAVHIGARVVIVHANYISVIRTEEYRQSWHRQNVAFWGPIGDYAAERDVRVAIENMWEFDPHLIGDLLDEIDHPAVCACLDIGHTRLFSDAPLETWLAVMGSWVIHTHLNNNNGKEDIHHALGNGVLDYHDVLEQIRALPTQPTMTLEMDTTADMTASLSYFKLAEAPSA